jgi:ABC-type branched-subunit amino acid transport system ATPase component
MMLELRGVSRRFGGISAVEGLSLTVREHSITALIGPNGSGKTVTFNLITGLSRLDHGEIRFNGARIDGWMPDRIALHGIARTFQHLKLFPEFSIVETLVLLQQPRGLGSSLASVGPRTMPDRLAADAPELLEFVGLWDKRTEPAGSLSYGQQKLLTLVGLLTMEPRPSLILLDEPMAGINPTLITTLVRLIRDYRERGRTFLIIEHDMAVMMDLCETLIVLDHGRKIAEGPPDAIRGDADVIEAYFGR